MSALDLQISGPTRLVTICEDYGGGGGIRPRVLTGRSRPPGANAPPRRRGRPGRHRLRERAERKVGCCSAPSPRPSLSVPPLCSSGRDEARHTAASAMTGFTAPCGAASFVRLGTRPETDRREKPVHAIGAASSRDGTSGKRGLSQSSPEAPNPPGYAPVGRTLKLPRGTLIKVLLAPLGGSSPSCIRRWIAMAAELRRQVVAMSAADRSSTFRSGKQFHRPYASGTMAEAGRTIGTWSSDRG